MPDVKTMRDVVEAAHEKLLPRLRNSDEKLGAALMATAANMSLGASALVNPTFIVTQKGLEAGCRAQLGCEGAPPSLWDEMPDGEKEAWLFKLRLGIAAAGGIVADEVVVVDTFNGCAAWVFTPTPEDGPMPVRLRDGDKLYIVRAKEE